MFNKVIVDGKKWTEQSFFSDIINNSVFFKL